MASDSDEVDPPSDDEELDSSELISTAFDP